ncbi:hypothetical protein K402DRAFT_95299 [Aulographum hederae CBS 113979]|uniref:Uncharacterized protein n=1 Tax=Aulographum hederae CBS 113979 TaxID=1176131 RepID=A0A6G1GY89_9PEZI|nr:hypothetical protein K402DRAFT_95299 [Aulographum hederae CBS 113979]
MLSGREDGQQGAVSADFAAWQERFLGKYANGEAGDGNPTATLLSATRGFWDVNNSLESSRPCERPWGQNDLQGNVTTARPQQELDPMDPLSALTAAILRDEREPSPHRNLRKRPRSPSPSSPYGDQRMRLESSTPAPYSNPRKRGRSPSPASPYGNQRMRLEPPMPAPYSNPRKRGRSPSPTSPYGNQRMRLTSPNSPSPPPALQTSRAPRWTNPLNIWEPQRSPSPSSLPFPSTSTAASTSPTRASSFQPAQAMGSMLQRPNGRGFVHRPPVVRPPRGAGGAEGGVHDHVKGEWDGEDERWMVVDG